MVAVDSAAGRSRRDVLDWCGVAVSWPCVAGFQVSGLALTYGASFVRRLVRLGLPVWVHCPLVGVTRGRWVWRGRRQVRRWCRSMARMGTSRSMCIFSVACRVRT